MTVAEGFRRAARQIDAMEVAGRTVSAEAAREEATYRRYMALAGAASGPIRFPPPQRRGSGVPPVTDASAVRQLSGGAWVVSGGGAGVIGSADGLTFAAAPVTSSEATFTCRLAAIQAVKPDTLNPGAKFGLMARSDLSDNAAAVAVVIAAGRGVHFLARPTAGTPLADQRPSSSSQGAGLLGSAVVLGNKAIPSGNVLLRPVWLRLVRHIATWIAYTSLDGIHWTAAGTPQGTEIVGAWVGLCVTAHGSGHVVRATFDHVTGFSPATFVRIGPP